MSDLDERFIMCGRSQTQGLEMFGVESVAGWVFIAITFVLAGLVKGVIGMGLPTLAMGLLGAVMAPAQAAAILILPSTVTNIWQLAAGPSVGALIRRLWSMMLCICVGTWAGAGLLTRGDANLAACALGIALVVYGTMGLKSVSFSVPRRSEVWLSPLIGLTTGVITGGTGLFVIPAVPYLQALGLDKEQLIQAFGLSFTVSTIALGVSLANEGILSGAIGMLSVVALAAAMAGMYCGQWIRARISMATFRTVFFAGLVILGLYIAFKNAL